MRGIAWIFTVFLVAGCADDDISLLSIRNETTVPIYALPYTSEFTDADWIAPFTFEEFYSINNDYLDAFAYFSLYYDSLIVYMKGYDEDPIKFYQDGATVNYDPILNPFTNPEVWKERRFNRHISGSYLNRLEEKRVSEHYFCIDPASVKSLSDTILHELNPAP